MEQATEVAERAFDAAKEEADRQGLMPEDDTATVSERVSSVVGSAAAAAEEALRERDKEEASQPRRRPVSHSLRHSKEQLLAK